MDKTRKKSKKKYNKGWNNIIQKPLAERFWYNVANIGVSKNECWPWTGATMFFGYGKMRRNYKFVGAHRISYELNIGPIPYGMCVLHHCDNPLCVNPSHLFLGTQVDNMKDMFAKGRNANQHQKGPNHV